MNTKALIIMTAALAIGACSKPTPGTAAKDGNGAASSANAAGTATASAGSDVQLNPGEWETAVEMSATGLPPSVAAAMKGTKAVHRSCITPEQARRPSGDMFSGKKDKNCTYEGFQASGGTLKGTVVCKAEGGDGTTRMTMDGHYGGDSFDVAMNMSTTGGPVSGMEMKTRTVGHRVGPCTGKD